MVSLDDLQWPVSYRFITWAPGGFSSQEITVDMWRLIDRHDETLMAGELIWRRSIATAMVDSCRLELVEATIWKEVGVPGLCPVGGYTGHMSGMASHRDKSLVMAFHTNHADRWGTRRHYLHGIPRSWVADDVLSSEGWTGAMRLGHIYGMGLQHDSIGGGFQQLLHYTGVVPISPENILGVAFRRVTSYSVCQHVDKAPDLVLGLWPNNPL